MRCGPWGMRFTSKVARYDAAALEIYKSLSDHGFGGADFSVIARESQGGTHEERTGRAVSFLI